MEIDTNDVLRGIDQLLAKQDEEVAKFPENIILEELCKNLNPSYKTIARNPQLQQWLENRDKPINAVNDCFNDFLKRFRKAFFKEYGEKVKTIKVKKNNFIKIALEYCKPDPLKGLLNGNSSPNSEKNPSINFIFTYVENLLLSISLLINECNNSLEEVGSDVGVGAINQDQCESTNVTNLRGLLDADENQQNEQQGKIDSSLI